MNREYVASSNIASVGYDPDSETLEIEFNSGAVWQYFNVSENVYRELLAGSVGKFFNA